MQHKSQGFQSLVASFEDAKNHASISITDLVKAAFEQGYHRDHIFDSAVQARCSEKTVRNIIAKLADQYDARIRASGAGPRRSRKAIRFADEVVLRFGKDASSVLSAAVRELKEREGKTV